MKIREIHVTRGPNYWSIRRHKLVVMVLDLEDMEEKPSNKVEGFLERLKSLFPSMIKHRCSIGEEGGFFKRVEDGTWMGHIIEHIALELQTLAGMDEGFGRTRGYGEKGVYNVVFSYAVESVGKYAAKAAVDVCRALIDGTEKEYDLASDIQKMRELRERDRLGPSTGSIIEEAVARGIPWIRLNPYSLCQLGYGANQKRIQATVTSETSSIGVELAGDKEETKRILRNSEIPVPKGDIISQEENLKSTCEYVGYPLVIKPIDGNHGRGITVDIKNYEQALKAFRYAKNVSRRIIIEQFIKGDDYRLLVINNRFVAGAKRTPAHVVGDGTSTIQQLIDQENSDPRRGYGHENTLTIIDINSVTMSLIKAKSYTLESILPKGEILILKDTANLSTGGTAEDVTDIIHPSNVSMAERISKIIDLDICGIDISTYDISKPLSETGGSVLEVNAGPGFRMHLYPAKGLPRNVAAPVVDKLFPKKGDTGRIPIVAVTGTNGKTTTNRLIAHIAKMKGYRVGYTTSEGIYIQNRMLVTGDCTGPASAEFVLKDPTVNFAALECARGGILRAGLGFGKCDVAIVTNVTADHIGLKGIQSVEQLARVKSVVPESVMPGGYAILNADDDLVYGMRKNINCNLALFSMDENNPRIKALQKLQGITAVYENGFVTICRGPWKMRVMKVSEIPLTYGGKAEFMIQNILPAILAANVLGISIEDMKMGLQTFIPSATTTPGRLNMFNFKKFDVLVDFAHNPAGASALKGFVNNYEASYKIGIIAGTGDRRDEDIIELGGVFSSMFDEIIIRQDSILRGRTGEEISKLLTQGILQKAPDMKISVIPEEIDALVNAVNIIPEKGLVVLCSDKVMKSTDFVMKLKEQEEKGEVTFHK